MDYDARYNGRSAAVGAQNLFVPREGLLYVIPALEAQYIVTHGYPPQQFRDAVPAGYYDREQAASIAADSGLIIKIVDIVDGRAELDFNGDGQADDSSALAISDAEREQLAGRYVVDQEL